MLSFNKGLSDPLCHLMAQFISKAKEVAGSDAQNHIVTQAFASSLDKNLIALGNRVSRKQQFVPALAAFYALPH